MDRHLIVLGAFASTIAIGASARLPAQTYATDTPSCPPVGKHRTNSQLVAYPATSDAGLRNMAKRHLPPGQAPLTLTLQDFALLQQDINTTFADASQRKTTFAPTREALQHLAVTDGTVSEGDLIQLAAYVTTARDEHPESVNCSGTDGLDIHINVGPKALHPSQYDGIVVEMIPQIRPRPKGWDSATLSALVGKQVLVVGGLTYDNEHLVNSDPQHSKSGQPPRMSLWEIHPITAFYVCAASSECTADQRAGWTRLADWSAARPVSH